MSGIARHGNKYLKTPHPAKEELERLYFMEFMSQVEIASKFKTTQKIVFRWFKDLGINSRIAAKRNQRGGLNHQWKCDKASYAAFHYRVSGLRGKANKCEKCGRSDAGIVYDWANQTGKYNEVTDYKMMCRSCHFKMDKAQMKNKNGK